MSEQKFVEEVRKAQDCINALLRFGPQKSSVLHKYLVATGHKPEHASMAFSDGANRGLFYVDSKLVVHHSRPGGHYEITVRIPLEDYTESTFYKVADAAGDAAVSGKIVPGPA